jgi:hypothetical protein
MLKGKHTEAQMIAALKLVEAGQRPWRFQQHQQPVFESPQSKSFPTPDFTVPDGA